MSASTRLATRFAERHPAEAAAELDGATPAAVAALLASAPTETALRVLARMQPQRAAPAVAALDDDDLPRLVAELDLGTLARVAALMGKPERERILRLLPAGRRAQLDELLSFPPGTAGHLMDTRVATFRRDTRVRAVLDWLAEGRVRRISDVVVVGDDNEFDGVVRVQDLVGAEPSEVLAMLERAKHHVQPMARWEDVVSLLESHRLASLPVVDLHGAVVGIIRHEGLVAAAQEGVAANLQQMVGGSAEERALSSPWVGVRGRLPWLHVNLVTAFFAAAVVGLFEDTIARFTALAVLLPVVAGQSGNTGAQALAVTMRALALREIRTSHASRVVIKELIVGAVNGLAIGVVTGIAVFAWSGSLGLSLVMLASMVLAMIMASLAGALIPVVLVKLGRDPATAASIILTTITDVAGFFSFLGLATWFSSYLGP